MRSTSSLPNSRATSTAPSCTSTAGSMCSDCPSVHLPANEPRPCPPPRHIARSCSLASYLHSSLVLAFARQHPRSWPGVTVPECCADSDDGYHPHYISPMRARASGCWARARAHQYHRDRPRAQLRSRRGMHSGTGSVTRRRRSAAGSGANTHDRDNWDSEVPCRGRP